MTDIFFGARPPPASTSALAANPPGAAPFKDEDCPVVDIRGGASTLTIAANVQQPTANDLRYQLSFNQLARQCFAQGGTLTIKVGVQGRVILGPAGTAGQVDVPLRYAVVREGVEPKTITTKFKRFSVTVPPGETNVLFTDVEDSLSFPMPSSQDLDAYVIYVGYDEQGDKNERRPAKKTTPKPKRTR